MIPLRQRTLLILLFVALATGGVIIQAMLQPELAPLDPGDLSGASNPDPVVTGPSEPASPIMQAPEDVREVGAQGTTVIHPLEVELTLLEHGSIDALGGIQPVGSGASARGSRRRAARRAAGWPACCTQCTMAGWLPSRPPRSGGLR